MMRCEICHEPIEETTCIMLSPFEGRGAHKQCMREVIMEAFKGRIGTEDDEIDSMVADAVEDMLTDYRPGEDRWSDERRRY